MRKRLGGFSDLLKVTQKVGAVDRGRIRHCVPSTLSFSIVPDAWNMRCIREGVSCGQRHYTTSHWNVLTFCVCFCLTEYSLQTDVDLLRNFIGV